MKYLLPGLLIICSLIPAAPASGSERSVLSMIDALHDQSAEVRYQAANVLGLIGELPELVVPELIEALEDEDLMVRGYSIDALSVFLNEPGVMDVIAGMLGDPDRDVRAVAKEILCLAGPDAVPSLLRMTYSENERARISSVSTIHKIINKQIATIPRSHWLKTPLLKRITQVDYDAVEMELKVYSRLIELISDESESVRFLTIYALNDFVTDTTDAVPHFLNALDKPGNGNSVVYSALMPYADHPGVLNAVISKLEDPDSMERKQAADWFLFVKPDAPKAIPLLIRMVTDGEGTEKWFALMAIAAMEIDAPGLLAALLEAANDEDLIVKRNAVFCLGIFDDGSKKVLDLLLEGLEDETPAHRSVAVHALAAIGKNSYVVVPELMRLAKEDEDIDVRQSAITALGSFGKDAEVAIPLLKQFSLADSNFAIPANSSLLLIGDQPERRMNKMISWLESGDEEVIELAALHIYGLGALAADAVPVLTRLLEEGESDSFSLVFALAEIGPDASEAIPIMWEYAEGFKPKSLFRRIIVEAIEKIEGVPDSG